MFLDGVQVGHRDIVWRLKQEYGEEEEGEASAAVGETRR